MVIVIHEKDCSDNEESIIGVVNSKENADSFIVNYYGNSLGRLIGVRDIRDSGIEYEYHYEINGLVSEDTTVIITLMSFTLNALS